MLNALKNLYVKLGGALTDTYAGIEGGKPVRDYILKKNVVSACAEKAEGGGGGAVSVLEVTASGNTLTTALTAQEIADLKEAGSYLVGNLASGAGQYQQTDIGSINYSSSGMTLIAYFVNGNENVTALTFTAASMSDHLTATLS